MATYGIQTFDATGKKGLDSNLMIGWRLVDTYTVPVGTSSTKDYTGVLPDGFTLSVVPACVLGGICHRLSVNGYSISATALTDTVTGNYLNNNTYTKIMVFLR